MRGQGTKQFVAAHNPVPRSVGKGPWDGSDSLVVPQMSTMPS